MSYEAKHSIRATDAPLRILCVTGYYRPAFVYGGPVRSVSALCEGLAKLGACVTVCTTDANGPRQRLDVPARLPVEVNGVSVFYFPVQWPLASLIPFYAPTLGRACQRSVADYDVVYISGTWTYAMWAAARAALATDIPYVVSPRGSFMSWSMSQKRLKKRLYLALIERRLVDGAAALHLTATLEQQQQDSFNFRPPSVVIPNGLDLCLYSTLPSRGSLRSRLRIPEQHSVGLFVGRAHKMKRIDLMVDALAIVVRRFPTAHLVVVGPDEDGAGLEAQEQARELGLSDHVHFTGLLSGTSLLEAYADADLSLLLSYRENFGMAAAEAMAAGLPVLLSDDVGLAEDVVRAGAGLVVEPTPERVAIGWAALLSDPMSRQAMAECGKQLVHEQFASGIVAQRMLSLLQAAACRQLASSGPSLSAVITI